MTKRPRIGVVGSSNVDLVTYVERMPVWGETISAPRFEMSHGGKGANQAVAAAKLGASVVMVSKVGADMLGEGVLKNFEALGVGTKHVQRVPGQSTGTATILVNPAGDNFILIVKGANGNLSPADVEAAGEDLEACDLILLQLEVPLETVYAALAFGKKRGVKTALNPAPAVRDLDMDRVSLASFLTPNETELAILTGMPVESEEEIEAAAKSLLARRIETIIVTLGSRGALLATAQGFKRIAPAKVQAIDSTGAGDAFIGSFARYHAADLGIEVALDSATLYAADSVTKRGAQKSFATEAEFEALLGKTGRAR
jgi:ribokinase